MCAFPLYRRRLHDLHILVQRSLGNFELEPLDVSVKSIIALVMVRHWYGLNSFDHRGFKT